MRTSRIATIIAVLAVILTACHSRPAPNYSPTPVTTPSGALSQPFNDSGKCHARHVNLNDPQAWEPDVNCTPGSTAGGLTIDQLCPVAHTRPIRPPVSYTEPLKQQQMQDYGALWSIGQYEEDHLISLELGGAPRDPRNLWTEPHQSPNEKDRVENAAHTYICAHPDQMAAIQQKIARDWVGLGRELNVIKP